jgi:hypothetical protein
MPNPSDYDDDDDDILMTILEFIGTANFKFNILPPRHYSADKILGHLL